MYVSCNTSDIKRITITLQDELVDACCFLQECLVVHLNTKEYRRLVNDGTFFSKII